MKLMIKSRYLSILTFVMTVGCAAFVGQGVAAGGDGQLPIRVISLNVPDSSREPFFEGLKLFSEKYAFAIRIAPTTPDNEYYTIQMWREDIEIIGGNTKDINPKEEVTIALYNNGTQPVNEASADFVSSSIKEFVAGIPGVSVK
ncbi:hypothetical protein [Mesorhizobium sp. M0199]|uniref:hypothetical protein n=1 Tax=Mesorhizobium sp. M0199 TaxID=2956911 RepID=UPI00333DDA58